MGEEIVARCDTCEFELYRGETYYQINGEVICEDCLGEFAVRLLAPFRSLSSLSNWMLRWWLASIAW